MELAQEQHQRLCCDSVRNCPRCKEDFCPHFASKTDFQFCQYCFHDIVLEDSIIKKDIEYKSLSGKKTFHRVMTARHLVFKGEDWMFAQQRVVDMTDDELGTTIEYHRAIFSEMLNEMEARKIAHNKQAISKMMKGATLKIPSVKQGLYTDGTPIIGMDSTVVTTTTVKRTRITATQTNSAQVAMSAIVALLKAQGLSGEAIKEKLIQMASGGTK